MKSIELTEDRKSKLLEMGKILFPEFNEWRYGKVTAEGNLEDFYNKTKDLPWEDREKHEQSCDFLWIEKDFKYEHDDDIERSETWVIHWFEFCTNEIVNELAWRNIETEILADCEYENFRMKLITKIFKDKLVGNNFHIIDYLYKQFQKLK